MATTRERGKARKRESEKFKATLSQVAHGVKAQVVFLCLKFFAFSLFCFLAFSS